MLGRNSSELDGEENAVLVYLMASANGRFFHLCRLIARLVVTVIYFGGGIGVPTFTLGHI